MNCFIVLPLLLCLYFSLGFSNITFIILSQNNKFNLNSAIKLQDSIKLQCKELNLLIPSIFISPRDFDISGDWTIFPLLTPILEASNNSQWIVLLQDRCNISLSLFFKTLQKYNSQKEIWFSRALYDSEATIIHHFGFYKDPTIFKYPYLGSGIVFSISLLKRLQIDITEGTYKMPDFHIDPAYEFALFVYKSGKGHMILNETSLCFNEGPDCAIYPKRLEFCGDPDHKSIYFAVKTCRKYHGNRVKAIKECWGRYSSRITFFSDIEDVDIPTVFLGVQNTEQGHCKKTIEILKYVEKQLEEDTYINWVALVDDDTILSVSRLASLLTCYNTKDPIILGERYRFGGIDGFDYATGGAGTLINRAALQMLADSCKCPRVDSPDDMILGTCAERLGINIIHIPQMHQARPPDYPPGRLANMDAITFHKHWMIDPVEVYRQLFADDDQKLEKDSFKKLEL